MATFKFESNLTPAKVLVLDARLNIEDVNFELVSEPQPQPDPEPDPTPEPDPDPTPDPEPEPEPEPSLTTWKNEKGHEFQIPNAKVRGGVFTPENRFGIALNGERAGTLSGRHYIGSIFDGGRYAAYLEGQSDLVFDGCVFDVSDPAPSGLNEEAVVRVQNCHRILFRNCTFLDSTGPKHAFRVHKTCSDIRFENCTVRTHGSVALIGRYNGQDDMSRLERVEFINIDCEAHGVDGFNPGIDPAAFVDCVVRGFKQSGRAPVRSPARPGLVVSDSSF